MVSISSMGIPGSRLFYSNLALKRTVYELGRGTDRQRDGRKTASLNSSYSAVVGA